MKGSINSHAQRFREMVKSSYYIDIEYIKKVFSKSTLKLLPGFFILFYAYLYFLGFIYLWAYFRHWKLNVIDMGFSIIDYATVPIFPVYLLGTGLITAFIIGRIIKNISTLIPHFWKIMVSSFVLGVSLGLPLSMFFRSATTTTKIYLVLLAVTFLISYLVRRPFIAIFVLFLLFPLLELYIGKQNASVLLPYSVTTISKKDQIPEVTIYTRHKLTNFDLFEEGDNRYSNLRLLADKNGAYYVVPDIFKHRAYLKKISLLTEQIDSNNRKVDDLSASAKNLIAKAELKNANKQLEEAAQLNQESHRIMEIVKHLSELISRIPYLSYSINKNDVILIEYNKETEW